MNDIVRRDPRAEWIARNRLHPLHAAMQSAQGGEVRWMGPHGVIRKNPHAVGFLGPNGIRRIDRSGGDRLLAAQAVLQQQQFGVAGQAMGHAGGGFLRVVGLAGQQQALDGLPAVRGFRGDRVEAGLAVFHQAQSAGRPLHL